MTLQHHFILLSNLFSSVKGRYNPSPATFPGWLAKLNESAFCNRLMILVASSNSYTSLFKNIFISFWLHGLFCFPLRVTILERNDVHFAFSLALVHFLLKYPTILDIHCSASSDKENQTINIGNAFLTFHLFHCLGSSEPLDHPTLSIHPHCCLAFCHPGPLILELFSPSLHTFLPTGVYFLLLLCPHFQLHQPADYQQSPLHTWHLSPFLCPRPLFSCLTSQNAVVAPNCLDALLISKS